MEEDTFQCKVQLCGFPALDEVQVEERVPKQEWSHWDPEVARRRSRVPIPASSSSDTESMEGNIDSDSEYGLESLMSDENSDSYSLYWEDISLPGDFADLRSQLLTPRGMSLSPINIPNLHVPSDYIPAGPIYSPTSPDYSPNMSPITVIGRVSTYWLVEVCTLVEATGCRLLRVGEYLLCYVSVPRPLHRVLHLSLRCDSCCYKSIIIINTNK